MNFRLCHRLIPVSLISFFHVKINVKPIQLTSSFLLEKGWILPVPDCEPPIKHLLLSQVFQRKIELPAVLINSWANNSIYICNWWLLARSLSFWSVLFHWLTLNLNLIFQTLRILALLEALVVFLIRLVFVLLRFFLNFLQLFKKSCLLLNYSPLDFIDFFLLLVFIVWWNLSAWFCVCLLGFFVLSELLQALVAKVALGDLVIAFNGWRHVLL